MRKKICSRRKRHLPILLTFIISFAIWLDCAGAATYNLDSAADNFASYSISEDQDFESWTNEEMIVIDGDAQGYVVAEEITDNILSANMLANGGFESGDNATWSVGNSCRIVNNGSEANTGSYALRIIANGNWNATLQNVAVEDNHEYRIEGFIRSNGITGAAPRIRVRWYDGNDKILATEYLYGATGTTGYEKKTLSVTSPANAVMLEIHPYVYQAVTSGTVWFDNVTVTDMKTLASIEEWASVEDSNSDDIFQWTDENVLVIDGDAEDYVVAEEITDNILRVNMLANGGFESGNNATWSVGNNCRIVNNSSEANTGAYALRITANGNWNATFQNVAVEDNHEYRIEGFIRSNGITGAAPRIRVRWYDGNDKILATEYLYGATGTTGYEKKTLSVTSPANAVMLEIHPYVYKNITSGTVWFDDIKVTNPESWTSVDEWQPIDDFESGEVVDWTEIDMIEGDIGDIGADEFIDEIVVVGDDIGDFGDGTVIIIPTPGLLNLLSNGGFESGNDGVWALGSNCSIVNNSSEANTGSYALRIAATGKWNSTHQNVTVKVGDNYKIEGYIRSNGIVGAAPRIRARWYDTDDKILGTEYLYGSVGTTGYVKKTLSVTAPANAVRLEIHPYLYQNATSGTAWFDDLVVSRQYVINNPSEGNASIYPHVFQLEFDGNGNLLRFQ